MYAHNAEKRRISSDVVVVVILWPVTFAEKYAQYVTRLNALSVWMRRVEKKTSFVWIVSEMETKCTACGKLKPKSNFGKNKNECKPCYSRHWLIKKNGCLAIPYDPTGDGRAWVDGMDVRIARKLAGIYTTSDMANICGWSQTNQVNYERPNKHLISLLNIWKMIRVCNGER